jgi:hypothetical protein
MPRARAILLLCTAAAIAGCKPAAVREAEDAEARAAIVEKHGTKAELCRAKRAVADAWLQAKDARRYEEADLYADIACQSADLFGGYLPADGKAAAEAEAMVDKALANAEQAATNASAAIDEAADEVRDSNEPDE